MLGWTWVPNGCSGHRPHGDKYKPDRLLYCDWLLKQVQTFLNKFAYVDGTTFFLPRDEEEKSDKQRAKKRRVFLTQESRGTVWETQSIFESALPADAVDFFDGVVKQRASSDQELGVLVMRSERKRCSLCRQTFAAGQASVTCALCGSWFHVDCLAMSQAEKNQRQL